MRVVHESRQDAVDAVVQKVKSAVQHERWMVALFTIDGDKPTELSRTTFSFPSNRFQDAVETLTKNLLEEVSSIRTTLPDDPLPMAPHIHVAPEDQAIAEPLPTAEEVPHAVTQVMEDDGCPE